MKELNTPIKKQRLSDWVKERKRKTQDTTILYLQKMHFEYKNTGKRIKKDNTIKTVMTRNTQLSTIDIKMKF